MSTPESTLQLAAPAGAARLEGRVVPRQHLDAPTRDAMFALLTSHFTGVERPAFDADLAEKHYALLLEDAAGALRGFSTLMLYRSGAPGRTISVVYSGDTIVERTWWGSPALARTWIRAVQDLAPAAGSDELYWLLLTSGCRTYRFLPVFFRSFYPSHDESGTPEAGTLLAALATERFGGRYDPATGIVRFEKPQVLAPDLLHVPEARALDPHVAYFLARNPGHLHGDELACLTIISSDNLTPAGRRMARLSRDG